MGIPTEHHRYHSSVAYPSSSDSAHYPLHNNLVLHMRILPRASGQSTNSQGRSGGSSCVSTAHLNTSAYDSSVESSLSHDTYQCTNLNLLRLLDLLDPLESSP